MQGRVGSDESQGLKHRQIYPDFGLREEARSNAHLDFTHRQSQEARCHSGSRFCGHFFTLQLEAGAAGSLLPRSRRREGGNPQS